MPSSTNWPNPTVLEYLPAAFGLGAITVALSMSAARRRGTAAPTRAGRAAQRSGGASPVRERLRDGMPAMRPAPALLQVTGRAEEGSR